VQVWLNLVDVRCIKCTFKVGNLNSYFRDLKKKIEHYQSSDFGQSSFQSSLFKFDLIAPIIDPKTSIFL